MFRNVTYNAADFISFVFCIPFHSFLSFLVIIIVLWSTFITKISI